MENEMTDRTEYEYNEQFLSQTAWEYDLDINIVRTISNKYPNRLEFYEQLELKLKEAL